MLHMIEYAFIYMKKKQSTEFARIMNVSDVVYSIMSLYKLLSSYWDRCIHNNVKHLGRSILQKELMSAGVQPEIFQGRGGEFGTRSL